MKIACMLGAMAIAGCATQMTKLGESDYRVSVHAVSFRNREVEAFRRARAEASAQCARERMEFRAIKTEAGVAANLPTDTVVLTFRCLSERDPEFHRREPVAIPGNQG